MTKWSASGADAVIDTFVVQEAIPGADIATVGPGLTTWRRTVGLAAAPQDGAVAPPTLFCIGSVSKTLTAAAILALRDAGKLALEEPLITYVPEAGAIGDHEGRIHAVTIRSLLLHTSGLQGDAASPSLRRWRPMPIDAVLRDPSSVAVVIPPGSAYKYSNLGYELLGAVIAAVAGMSYEAYVRRTVLDPLGMDSTVVDPAINPTARRATGHGPAGVDGRREIASDPPSGVVASGGWWSTAADLAKWVAEQLPGRTRATNLTSETLAEMHRAVVVSSPDLAGGYGLGWRTYRRDGRRTIGHGGLVNGFEARIELDPAAGIGVAVLLNAVGHDAAGRLAALLLSELRAAQDGQPGVAPATSKSRAMPVDTSPANGLVGRYREVEFTAEIAVEADDGVLVLVTDDGRRIPLESTPDQDRYRVTDGRAAGELLIALRDAAGAIDAVNVAGAPYARISRSDGRPTWIAPS
jgi:CubicO group peptidase (beta-lactamase class C family)